MARFREVLEREGLFDLRWRGDKFTWSNKHHVDETFTKERIDRAVANLKWKDIFKEGWVEVLAARCSDHRPLLLCMNQESATEWRRMRLFRHEKTGLSRKTEEVFKRVWNERSVEGDTPMTL